MQLEEVPVLDPGEGRIPLFMPNIPRGAAEGLIRTLGSRWIGQGPQVTEFEGRFSRIFARGRESVAVGSGTDALHLAYLLSGLGPGDEVLTPVFTCTATNLPLLYVGASPVFVDVEPGTLNLSVEDARRKASERTKAIVCVHYGGLPCNMRAITDLASELGVPVIEDAAHALGASYEGVPVGAISDFTMFSFQAIKHITTGDGGMLTLADPSLRAQADSLRWFGIDRPKKQQGIWENDISDLGYKYQMTDLAASMGLAALEEWNWTLDYRRQLFDSYLSNLATASSLDVIAAPTSTTEHAAWLFTIAVDRRKDLQRKLLEHGIESNQVHYRNDRYSIFGGRQPDLPNMDAIEDRYLVLPLHTQMTLEDVDRICSVIQSGW